MADSDNENIYYTDNESAYNNPVNNGTYMRYNTGLTSYTNQNRKTIFSNGVTAYSYRDGTVFDGLPEWITEFSDGRIAHTTPDGHYTTYSDHKKSYTYNNGYTVFFDCSDSEFARLSAQMHRRNQYHSQNYNHPSNSEKEK